MRAIIVSAGQGKRLLPHTESTPKCLLNVLDDLSVLELQLRTLVACGIRDVSIMVGFHAEKVEQTLAQRTIAGLNVRTCYNLLNEYRALAERAVDLGNDEIVLEVANKIKYYAQLAFSVKLGFILESAAYDLCSLLENAFDNESAEILRPYLHCCAEGFAINTLSFDDSVRYFASAFQWYELVPQWLCNGPNLRQFLYRLASSWVH